MRISQLFLDEAMTRKSYSTQYIIHIEKMSKTEKQMMNGLMWWYARGIWVVENARKTEIDQCNWFTVEHGEWWLMRWWMVRRFEYNLIRVVVAWEYVNQCCSESAAAVVCWTDGAGSSEQVPAPAQHEAPSMRGDLPTGASLSSALRCIWEKHQVIANSI